MKTVQQQYTSALETHEPQIPIGQENRQNSQFSRLLIEAIDEGLSCLRKSTKDALYFHLEQSYNISKKEIPERLEEFTVALEAVFGEGAKLIEIKIIEQLHKNMGTALKYHPESDDLIFIDYIRAYQRRINFLIRI